MSASRGEKVQAGMIIPHPVMVAVVALDRTEESPYELWRWEEPLRNRAR